MAVGIRGELLGICGHSRLEYVHRRRVHNLNWQFIQVRDYSIAEGMLAVPGITPLLVSLESMTAKPRVGGDKVSTKVMKSEYVHT